MSAEPDSPPTVENRTVTGHSLLMKKVSFEDVSVRNDLPFFGKDVGKAQILERLGALEDTVSSGTLGVNDTFWDAFSIEMR